MSTGKLLRYLLLVIILIWGIYVDSSGPAETQRPLNVPSGPSFDFGFRARPGFPLASSRIYIRYIDHPEPVGLTGESQPSLTNHSFQLELGLQRLAQIVGGIPLSLTRYLYRFITRSESVTEPGGSRSE